MSLPKFTAEASLYKSNTSYSVVTSEGTNSTLAITPQIGTSPYGCYGCRTRCFNKYGDGIRLEDCLDSCGCDF
jgi:hypothetical protein